MAAGPLRADPPGSPGRCSSSGAALPGQQTGAPPAPSGSTPPLPTAAPACITGASAPSFLPPGARLPHLRRPPRRPPAPPRPRRLRRRRRRLRLLRYDDNHHDRLGLHRQRRRQRQRWLRRQQRRRQRIQRRHGHGRSGRLSRWEKGWGGKRMGWGGGVGRSLPAASNGNASASRPGRWEMARPSAR